MDSVYMLLSTDNVHLYSAHKHESYLHTISNIFCHGNDLCLSAPCLSSHHLCA